MASTSPIEDAAAAIAAKASRLAEAAAKGGKNAAAKQRQSNALRRLATVAATGPDAVRAAFDGNALPDIGEDDRRAAGGAVWSLATRRESRGTARMLDAPLKRGWEKGGDDFGLPIHRPTRLDAVALYDLAVALYPEDYWVYLKGLLLERLGDDDGAVRTFEAVGGHYAQAAALQLPRCRKKRDGARKTTQPPAVDDAAAPDDADARAERAAATAQRFAEHLADRDYSTAATMLARGLALTADDLAREYEAMLDYADVDADAPIEIMVMSSSDDMPGLTPDDLGWVYVAMSGDGFSEAVTVVVTREGDGAKIREIEWGRP